MFCLSSSRPMAGIPFTRDPVDMTIPFFASCVVTVPFESFTETVFFPVSVPVPSSQVILFFLKRNSTPLEFCVLTARERFIATLYSVVTSPTFTPNAFAPRARCATAALSSSAFAGMHPQSTQVPPSPSRSTTPTVSPSCAQRIAPTYPAGPPPRKITSKEAIGIRSFSESGRRWSEYEHERILDQPPQSLHEARAGGAVHCAMVAAHCDTNASAHRQRSVHHDGDVGHRAHREDRDLRRIDDRGEFIDTEHSEVGDGARGAS